MLDKESLYNLIEMKLARVNSRLWVALMFGGVFELGAQGLFDDIAGLSPAARDALVVNFDARTGVVVNPDDGVVEWEGYDGNGQPVVTAVRAENANTPTTNITRNSSGTSLVFTENDVSHTQHLFARLVDENDDALLSGGAATIFWRGFYSGANPQGNAILGRYAYNLSTAQFNELRGGMNHQRRDAAGIVGAFVTAVDNSDGGGARTLLGSSIAFLNDQPTVWTSVYDFTAPGGEVDFYATPSSDSRIDLSVNDPIASQGTHNFDGTLEPTLYIGAISHPASSSSSTGGFSFIGEMSQLIIFEGVLDAADIALVEAYLDEISVNEQQQTEQLTWSGAVDNQWDTVTENWQQASAPALWFNQLPAPRALFAGGEPKLIDVAEAIKVAGLTVTEPGYELSGLGSLDLPAAGFFEIEGDLSVAVPVAVDGNISKTGLGQLNVSDAFSADGLVSVREGRMNLLGSGSLTLGGLGVADTEDDRATVLFDASGLVELAGAPIVGAGVNSAGALVINGGDLQVESSGRTFLELGGGVPASDSYGSMLVTGGGYLSGSGPAGIRVGNHGIGHLLQTGGVVSSSDFFGIGGLGELAGRGVADIFGGTIEVDPSFRLQVGFRAGSTGALNLGSQAGGNGVINHLNVGGLAVGGHPDTSTARFNFNAGRLVLGGPLYQSGNSSDAVINFDGGTLVAGADNITLVAAGFPQVFVGRNGLSVDTAGFTATIASGLSVGLGLGVYPAGGELSVSAGGSGYLGVPLVNVTTDGQGAGAMATARLQDDEIAAVVMTAAGSGYQVGDLLTFEFVGGGAEVPAAPLVYSLTEDDLAEVGNGGLVKVGAGQLNLQGNFEYRGDTVIEEGSLIIDGFMGDSLIEVMTGTRLGGNIDTLGDIRVEGQLEPGSAGVGFIQSTGNLTMAAGSELRIDLVDWNGFAGVGYDLMSFSEIDIEATSEDTLTLQVEASDLQNFVDEARSFEIANAFSINGLTSANWQIATTGFVGNGEWTLREQNGTLFLDYEASDSSGSDYLTWLDGFPDLVATGPFDDSDGDGIVNLLEYVLGGDPSIPGSAVLPSASLGNDGSLDFVFRRRAGSVGELVQAIEYSTNLSDWTRLEVPSGSGGAFSIQTDDPVVGVDTVSVALGAELAEDERLFVRLVVELLD